MDYNIIENNLSNNDDNENESDFESNDDLERNKSVEERNHRITVLNDSISQHEEDNARKRKEYNYLGRENTGASNCLFRNVSKEKSRTPGTPEDSDSDQSKALSKSLAKGTIKGLHLGKFKANIQVLECEIFWKKKKTMYKIWGSDSYDISKNIFFSTKLNAKVEEFMDDTNKPIIYISKASIEKDMIKIKRFEIVQANSQIIGDPKQLSNNFFKMLQEKQEKR